MIDIKTHKIHKYLKNKCDEMLSAKRSNYYRFGSNIIRLSDHIGRNSSGSHSIIIDRRGGYMIHTHSNGNIVLMNYEEVKRFISTLALIQDIAPQTQNAWENEIINKQELKDVKEKIKKISDLEQQLEMAKKVNVGNANSIHNYRLWFEEHGIQDPFKKGSKKRTLDDVVQKIEPSLKVKINDQEEAVPSLVLEIPEGVLDIAEASC